MDLLDILRRRIDALPAGEYSAGLRAVLQHVDVASRHLSRGQSSGDDTAFTDAIYRTNQAFEGSLKEAFRVLANKEPGKITPAEIETYIQRERLLRGRVVAQFAAYRKDWRNPSTHDYRMDFDEDEALLEIISVCGFAIVLIDQISERVHFNASKASAARQRNVEQVHGSLLDRAASAILRFYTCPRHGR